MSDCNCGIRLGVRWVVVFLEFYCPLRPLHTSSVGMCGTTTALQPCETRQRQSHISLCCRLASMDRYQTSRQGIRTVHCTILKTTARHATPSCPHSKNLLHHLLAESFSLPTAKLYQYLLIPPSLFSTKLPCPRFAHKFLAYKVMHGPTHCDVGPIPRLWQRNTKFLYQDDCSVKPHKRPS